jgi:hypothetical protein
MPEDADEELQVCYLKNGNLKKKAKFQPMFSLDEENRKSFLESSPCGDTENKALR